MHESMLGNVGTGCPHTHRHSHSHSHSIGVLPKDLIVINGKWSDPHSILTVMSISSQISMQSGDAAYRSICEQVSVRTSPQTKARARNKLAQSRSSPRH